jgi:short-subunit dehydrogenase
MANKISVLITGASTGIGRGLALDLASEGNQVFASVRSRKDGDLLMKDGPSIIPILFDVTDEKAVLESVADVRSRIEKSHTFSIINNAGIAVAGPIEDLSIGEIKHQFDVNVFGALTVTKSYLPLLREQSPRGQKGRIVNISSVSGLVSSPFLGPYSASKYALEAFSDALRREMLGENIKVLLIEPGPIQTPIWQKGLGGGRATISARYEKPLARFEAQILKSVATALPADRVTDAVREALFSSHPRARQIVTGFQQRMQIEMARLLPTQWIDSLIGRQLFRD